MVEEEVELYRGEEEVEGVWRLEGVAVAVEPL